MKPKERTYPSGAYKRANKKEDSEKLDVVHTEDADMTEEIKGDPLVLPATFADACSNLGFAKELLQCGDILDENLK